MIVPDDVATWFKTQMTVAAVTTAVPGGFWNGRPSESGSAPYGVFRVTRQGTEFTSQAELPKLRIDAAVYIDQTAATQAQGVEIAIGQAMPIIYSGATAVIRNGAGTVIHVEPRDFSADVAFPLRGKNDVVAAKFGWEVWVQAATSGV